MFYSYPKVSKGSALYGRKTKHCSLIPACLACFSCRIGIESEKNCQLCLRNMQFVISFPFSKWTCLLNNPRSYLCFLGWDMRHFPGSSMRVFANSSHIVGELQSEVFSSFRPRWVISKLFYILMKKNQFTLV